MDRVHPARDAALDARFPRTWPCWVRIALDDGTAVEERVDHPLGDPENFPSPATMTAKFERLASRVLPPARAHTLAERVRRMAADGDVRPTLALARADD